MRTSIFEFVYRNKDLYTCFFKQPCFSNFIPKFMRYLMEEELLPIFLFSYGDDAKVDLLYLNYISSYIHLAHLNYWVETDFETSPSSIAKSYSQLLKDLDYVSFNKIGTTYQKEKIRKKSNNK